MGNSSKRILSIDALRGFDMIWIMGFGMFVKLAGRATGTDIGSTIADQMEHVRWDGLHWHDLIFPIFVFLAGASWPFSLDGQRAKGVPEWRIFLRLFKRFVVLFVLGLLVSGIMRFDFQHLLYMSVLGRIAFAWFIAASTLFFLGPRKTVFVAAGLFAAYWLALRFIPPMIEPGCDPWVYSTNLVYIFEKWLMPGHYHQFGGEGIISALGGSPGCAYLGIFAGLILKRSDWSPAKKSEMLGYFSMGLAVAAALASLVCPCVKMLWNPTFVLMTSAIAMALLSLFHWLIDVKGWTAWSFFFRVVGVNAITIYLLKCYIDFNFASRRILIGTLNMLPYHWVAPVTTAGAFVLAWLMLLLFYRKKIFFKV